MRIITLMINNFKELKKIAEKARIPNTRFIPPYKPAISDLPKSEIISKPITFVNEVDKKFFEISTESKIAHTPIGK